MVAVGFGLQGNYKAAYKSDSQSRRMVADSLESDDRARRLYGAASSNMAYFAQMYHAGTGETLASDPVIGDLHADAKKYHPKNAVVWHNSSVFMAENPSSGVVVTNEDGGTTGKPLRHNERKALQDQAEAVKCLIEGKVYHTQREFATITSRADDIEAGSQISSEELKKGSPPMEPVVLSVPNRSSGERTAAPKTDGAAAPKTDEAGAAPKTDGVAAPKTDGVAAPKTDGAAAPKTDGAAAPKTDGAAAPKTDG
ncbi:MAG: hypothetical protein KKD39_01330, partial [Candidatus Altiarchaeota archaeon]|nr:hypothetical protein [Candidatus Altiarchaeota archaeon]